MAGVKYLYFISNKYINGLHWKSVTALPVKYIIWLGSANTYPQKQICTDLEYAIKSWVFLVLS